MSGGSLTFIPGREPKILFRKPAGSPLWKLPFQREDEWFHPQSFERLKPGRVAQCHLLNQKPLLKESLVPLSGSPRRKNINPGTWHALNDGGPTHFKEEAGCLNARCWGVDLLKWSACTFWTPGKATWEYWLLKRNLWSHTYQLYAKEVLKIRRTGWRGLCF